MPHNSKYEIEEVKDAAKVIEGLLMFIFLIVLACLFSNADENDRRAVAIEHCLHNQPVATYDDPKWVDRCVAESMKGN